MISNNNDRRYYLRALLIKDNRLKQKQAGGQKTKRQQPAHGT
jgi:hypothetical protein